MCRDRLLHACLAAALMAAAVFAQARVPNDFRRIIALVQPEHRERLQAQAAAWAGWSPAARSAFSERARRWDALPQLERRMRRDSWAAWRMLPAGERARLRHEAARLAAMPPAERAAWQARFDALDLSTRRGWMLGPVLGADYARLQPLLAQVSTDQHGALLRTLRAMTPVQRGDLAVLVQRTPPAERDELRRALVSTSDANRDAWLRLRLER